MQVNDVTRRGWGDIDSASGVDVLLNFMCIEAHSWCCRGPVCIVDAAPGSRLPMLMYPHFDTFPSDVPCHHHASHAY